MVVDIAENGFQIAIVDGDNYYLYIYEDDNFLVNIYTMTVGWVLIL